MVRQRRLALVGFVGKWLLMNFLAYLGVSWISAGLYEVTDRWEFLVSGVFFMLAASWSLLS